MKKAITVLGVIPAGLWAQSPDPAKLMAEQSQMAMQSAGKVQTFGPIGIQAAMAGTTPTITGAPYSAEAVTERVQTLVDGNRIVQTTTATVARDSLGRVRRDESLGIVLGNKTSSPKMEMIEDPVAGVHWILDPQAKTAVKTPIGKSTTVLANSSLPAPGPERTWFYASGTPGSQITIQTLAKRNAEADATANRSDLGTQTIEGVSAQGTRVTRTLATGTVGNEQPLVIVTETWYSPELKVLVMSKTEDPRMGVTTYKLTNLQRSEPSAALFEVPPDYALRDQPGNMWFYKEPPKEQ